MTGFDLSILSVLGSVAVVVSGSLYFVAKILQARAAAAVEAAGRTRK